MEPMVFGILFILWMETTLSYFYRIVTGSPVPTLLRYRISFMVVWVALVWSGSQADPTPDNPTIYKFTFETSRPCVCTPQLKRRIIMQDVSQIGTTQAINHNGNGNGFTEAQNNNHDLLSTGADASEQLLLPAPERLSPSRDDDQADIPPEMMGAGKSHDEPEQNEAEQSSTTGPSLTRVDAPVEIAADIPHEPDQTGQHNGKEPLLAVKRNKAEIAIVLMNRKASFFQTPEGDTYAEIRLEDHHEVWSTRSKEFELFLRYEFYQATQAALKKTDLMLTILHAETVAMFDGLKQEVGLRITRHGNAIYIDLCNPKWQQIEITPVRWRVIEMKASPVRFRRSKGMLALPHPERNGDLNHIRNLLNLDNDSNFILVASYLIGAMNPSGPFPILIIQGEQGSGKSTLTNCIRNLLDPSSVPSRTLPRTERDLAISAEASRLLCYDNVSGIKDTMSDAFCRIATGGGFGTRTLYKDKSEELFNSTRPMLFNGISDLVVKHDFADRALVVTLPLIKADNRRSMAEIKRDWHSIKPYALGAICDAVKEALSNHEDVRLDRSPRMADFTKWVVAAEPVLPWERGRFMAEYEKNRFELIEVAIESDPISLAIVEMMDRLDVKKWVGTPTQLLKDLAGYVPNNGANKKGWPQAPNIFTNRLRRVQTFLRAMGIEVEHTKSGKRLIRLWKRDAENSEPAEREKLHLAAG